MGSNGGAYAELFGFETGPPAYKPVDRTKINADKLAREVQASQQRLQFLSQHAARLPQFQGGNLMGLLQSPQQIGQQPQVPQQQGQQLPPQQGLIGGIHRGTTRYGAPSPAGGGLNEY